MKKIAAFVLTSFMLFLSLQAQQVVTGDHTEKRAIGSFHAVETSAGIAVVLTKGSKEELAISASDKAMLEKIRTEVRDGVLKISRDDTWKFWNKWKNWKVTVYVSYTRLDAVRATSGGSVSGTGLNLDKLSAKLNSGGVINLSGKVDGLDVEGNSGAQFKGYALSAANCKADASSGAGIQVTVTKEITAKANSGGFIRFKGDGLIRDINVNSGGSVKREKD
jgi:hypothetical protein